MRRLRPAKDPFERTSHLRPAKDPVAYDPLRTQSLTGLRPLDARGARGGGMVDAWWMGRWRVHGGHMVDTCAHAPNGRARDPFCREDGVEQQGLDQSKAWTRLTSKACVRRPVWTRNAARSVGKGCVDASTRTA